MSSREKFKEKSDRRNNLIDNLFRGQTKRHETIKRFRKKSQKKLSLLYDKQITTNPNFSLGANRIRTP